MTFYNELRQGLLDLQSFASKMVGYVLLQLPPGPHD